MLFAREKLRRDTKLQRAPRPPAVVWIPALLVGAAMALPLAYLLLRAFESGWTQILSVALRDKTLSVLLGSVALAALVTAASVAIAVPLAWLTGRSDLPGRRMWAVLAALPLVIPSYVGGLVLVSMFGPKGFLQ